MNILIIDLSARFGGASMRVLSLMKQLSPHGVSVAVIQDSPVAAEAIRAGFKVFPVGKRKLDPMILPRLIRLIDQEKIQILDTQNPQSKFWGSLASLFTRTALISTLNSWYANEHGEKSLRGRLYAFLESVTNFALDRYIVVSKMIYQSVLGSGIQPDKVDLIYNAIDTDQSQVSGNRARILNDLQLPSDSVIFISVGRLTWAKGYEDLIQAFRLLADEHPSFYCLIAGDGELRNSLERQIVEAQLKDRILLLGHCSHERILALVQSADVFVMSSRSEGTPIALLEAASFAKPIAATNVGGIPELVVDQIHAALLPSGDTVRLADTMVLLATDRRYAAQLGQNAYKKVKEEFSLQAQAAATVLSYSKALREQKDSTR